MAEDYRGGLRQLKAPLKKLSALFGKGGAEQSLGHEFLWVVAGMLFSMLGGLLTVKILSNMLEITEFGEYTLLFSIASFMISVFFTTLGQINLRYIIIARDAGELDRFKAWQHSTFLGLALLSALLLLPVAQYAGNMQDNRMAMFICLSVLILVWGKQISQQFVLMAFRLRKEIGMSQIIGAIARPLGVLAAVLWVGQNPEFAILGLAMGFLLLAISQQYFLNRYWQRMEQDSGQPRTGTAGRDVLNMKNYLSYGMTYALIGLATITVLIADRWLLSFFGTLKQVAIYAALMQVALAPVAFSHAVLSRLAAPILFSSQKAGTAHIGKRQYSILVLAWLGISGIVLLGAVLFHPAIVRLLTNSDFAEYSYLLPWMVLGLLLERTMQVLELKGSVLLQTRAYMVSRLSLIASVPLFEYLFLLVYGFDWLVLGLIVATGLGVVSTLLINRFVLRSSVWHARGDQKPPGQD